MKTFGQFVENANDLQESMAVHAYPVGGGKFKVHKVGSKVNPDHVKVGDTLSSSDLDDLSDAGHKVKEVKKPLKEESEEVVTEKLTDDAKKNIQTALGPKTKGNAMRSSSQSARAIIALAKTKKENLK